MSEFAGRRIRTARWITASAVLFVCVWCPACDFSPRTQNATPQDSLGPIATPSLLDGVRPASIPADVKAACDVAEQAINRAIGTAKRRDGTFKDMFGNTQRTGCRMILDGPATSRDTTPTVATVETALRARGWSDDVRFEADGPDGQDIGMRSRGVLCIISASWDGGDDSEPDSAAVTNPPTAAADSAKNAYDMTVDCFSDVVDITDLSLPDWSITALRLPHFDSLYSVSPRIHMPPYFDVDFDGDGQTDAAITIEERSTGRQGFVIVSRNPAIAPLVVGAGQPIPGVDRDLGWVTLVETFHRGSINTGISIAQPADMMGDGLLLQDTASRSGLLYWNGRTVVYLPTATSGG